MADVIDRYRHLLGLHQILLIYQLYITIGLESSLIVKGAASYSEK